MSWQWTSRGLEQYAEQMRHTTGRKPICPMCGADLYPTCLGCGARFACPTENCPYEEKCSCTDYE